MLDWRRRMSNATGQPKITTVGVFGSSRAEEPGGDYELARQLGAALAEAGYGIACGGYGGAMEAVSRGAAEAGGHVIGVVAAAISTKANPWVVETKVVPQWQDRLMQLIRLGDGYVALAGGTGTLVELAVAWEMLHKHLLPPKPLIALGEFWHPVIMQIEAADPRSRGLVQIAPSVAAAINALRTFAGGAAAVARTALDTTELGRDLG